jgi:hypothetical protein
MDLRCQWCGERIVARSFGKCPGCYRELPENLRLSAREREIEAMEERWRMEEDAGRKFEGGGGGDMGSGSI